MHSKFQTPQISILLLILMLACNQAPKQQGSTEYAKEQNDNKIQDKHLEKDAEFLVKAIDGGFGEIELGKLAIKNALMQDVKDFGKRMKEDHSKLNEQLKELAFNKQISVPGTPGDETQAKISEFSKISAENFDEVYVKEMIGDHEKDIKEFEEKINDEEADADIRRWSKESLPILKSHLTEIRAIDKKLNHKKAL